MKLTNFVEKYKILTITLMIIFMLVGSWFLLDTFKPRFWTNYFNQYQTQLIKVGSPDLINYDSEDTITGKIESIDNEKIVINTGDSYYSVATQSNTTVKLTVPDGSDSGIQSLHIGQSVSIKIIGSKFTSFEPFQSDSIIVNKDK
ncbi:MAG: hypothetical protein ACD_58C00060G0002 [uncultured bacterium]|nr:MAG: hypothetical protein ACD_58C00060G0002 [uncultured bacterium]